MQALVPEGRGAWLSGMAFKKALPLHKLPRCCERWSIITKKNQHRVPLFLPSVAFPPEGAGWAAPCPEALGAAQMQSEWGDFDRASDTDFHFNARQEEPTYHSICRNKRVVTNLHVYGISLAEPIYI